MNDDVCAEFDGTGERWRRSRVVDDQRQPVLMGDTFEFLDIYDVEFRVPDRLGIDGLGFVIDRLAQTRFVFGVNETNRDAQLRQCVMEQVIGTAIKRRSRNDLVTRIGDGQYGEGFGSLP